MCGFGRLVVGASLVNTPVVRSVRRGGYLSDGGYAGLRCVNAYYAPSNGSWNYGGGLRPHQSRHNR